MKKTLTVLIIVVVLLIIILAMGPFYILEEGQQAIITRFGKIVDSETTAGLHLKTPFVDNVLKFSNKILSWDGDAKELPTKENQFIVVDTTARWRISDVEKFYEKLQTMESAYTKLDQIIEAQVRTVIAENFLREAVRSSNEIMIKAEAAIPVEGLTENTEEDTEMEELLEFTSSSKNYETINKGREVLSERILALAIPSTPEYGIELLDIFIRQIRYSDRLTPTVYERMIKERNQEAQAYRSRGEGKKEEWLGKLNNEQLTIISEAEAKAQEIKGAADAEATRIYNDAYELDEEFFEFWRTMESYKKVLPQFKKTLSTDMEYFDYLYNTQGN